jgi:hypothetical protein
MLARFAAIWLAIDQELRWRCVVRIVGSVTNPSMSEFSYSKLGISVASALGLSPMPLTSFVAVHFSCFIIK